MTTTQEALKMAIETMAKDVPDWECEHGFHWTDCKNKECEIRDWWKTFNACKEALEQNTFECNKFCGEHECKEHQPECKRIKQQEQEPVAWMDEFGNCEFTYQMWMKEEPNVTWTPVYTHPAKQLSDDEIKQVVTTNAGSQALFYMLKDDVIGSDFRKCIESFARAIEAKIRGE